MVNLVSLSRVQVSVTVQTLECCSCLNAELKHINWVKAVGKEAQEGRKRKVDGGRGWREAQGVSYCHGGRGGLGVGLHPFRPFKNKTKQPKHQVKLKEQ
jgi:hypothetical protein